MKLVIRGVVVPVKIVDGRLAYGALVCPTPPARLPARYSAIDERAVGQSRYRCTRCPILSETQRHFQIVWGEVWVSFS